MVVRAGHGQLYVGQRLEGRPGARSTRPWRVQDSYNRKAVEQTTYYYELNGGAHVKATPQVRKTNNTTVGRYLNRPQLPWMAEKEEDPTAPDTGMKVEERQTEEGGDEGKGGQPRPGAPQPRAKKQKTDHVQDTISDRKSPIYGFQATRAEAASSASWPKAPTTIGRRSQSARSTTKKRTRKPKRTKESGKGKKLEATFLVKEALRELETYIIAYKDTMLQPARAVSGDDHRTLEKEVDRASHGSQSTPEPGKNKSRRGGMTSRRRRRASRSSITDAATAMLAHAVGEWPTTTCRTGSRTPRR